MSLKSFIQRFRAWQREPFCYDIKPGRCYHCANCGNTFEGNFCPACGQKYNVAKKDLPPEDKDTTLLLGFTEASSVLSYLIQIFARPGYLIGDYISGRQRVCGSPIDMLCYVALAVMLVNGFVGNAVTDKTLSVTAESGVLRTILEWLVSHLDWATLIQTVLLIIPTMLLFRYAPRHAHHSFVDGVYIQLFMSSLVLFCIMLRALFGDWTTILIPIFYFIAYHQLFGYGVWGTLWRTILCLGIILYLAGVIMMGIFYVSGAFSTVHSAGTVCSMLVALLLLGIGIFLLGWWIGKKKYRLIRNNS